MSRKATITIRDIHGRVWQGDGENLALAVRDLGRRHAAADESNGTRPEQEGQGQGQPAEPRWRLTPAGERMARRLAFIARLTGREGR